MKLTDTQQKTLEILNDLDSQKLNRKDAIAALVDNGFQIDAAIAEVAQALGEGDDVIEI